MCLRSIIHLGRNTNFSFSGALAGIIVAGSTAAISIVALLAFLRFWYTKDRQKNMPKKLKAMGLYEKSDIGRGGSFSRIGDVDEGDIEAGTQPKCKGKQLFAFLPSVCIFEACSITYY